MEILTMKITLLLLCCFVHFIQCSVSKELIWPEICSKFPFGEGKVLDQTENRDRRCLITFDGCGDCKNNKKAQREYCEIMYPDNLYKFEYKGEELSCYYRREFSCSREEISVKENCFTLLTTPVTHAEAVQACAAFNGTLAKGESGPLNYFTNLFSMDSVYSYWVGGFGKYENTPMAFTVQRDPMHSHREVGSFDKVSAEELHSVLCIKAAKKIPTTAIKIDREVREIDLCKFMNESLNIMAAKINETCYSWTQSVVGAKRLPTEKTKDEAFASVHHFHQKCKFGGVKSFAVSPNSPNNYEVLSAMALNQSSSFLLPAVLFTNWDPLTVNGIKDTYLDKTRKQHDRQSIFAYILESKKKMNMYHTQYWGDDQPVYAKGPSNPVDFPSIILAFNENRKLENTLAARRSQIVCAQGAEEDGSYHCPTNWTMLERGAEGALCYFYKSKNECIDYEAGKLECQNLGGETSMAMIRDQFEEQAVTEAIDQVLGNGTKVLSIWLGATDRNYNITAAKKPKTGYHWDLDGSSIDAYQRWDSNEPNQTKGKNGKSYESCLTLKYYYTREPVWNDLVCDRTQQYGCTNHVNSVRGVVCTKKAVYKFNENNN